MLVAPIPATHKIYQSIKKSRGEGGKEGRRGGGEEGRKEGRSLQGGRGDGGTREKRQGEGRM